MKEKFPKILVIAKTVPLHDRASGDYRLYQLLNILAQEAEVDYLSTWHTASNSSLDKPLSYLVRDGSFSTKNLTFLEEKYFEDLRKIGVHPLNQVEPIPFTIRPTNDYDIRPFLREKQYDVIWIEFFYLADQYIEEIRKHQPWAHVIVDSVDLHFRRLARQCTFLEKDVKYMVNNKQEKKKLGKAHEVQLRDYRNYADHVKDNELKAYEKCDAVVLVSDDDQKELKRHLPHLSTLFVPNIHRMPQAQQNSPEWSARHGVIFVGNFDHGPNNSSAIFLKHEVAPAVATKMGAIPFYIVGSNPPLLVKNMAHYGPLAENFIVTGYVPNTLEYLNRAKVSVAPILFGAGMNGKIGEAMAAGVPVVTTWLGANGMGLTHEQNCLVAETPEEFAIQIERLHKDEALWNRIRSNALQFLSSNLSTEFLAQQIRKEVKQSFNLKKVRQLQRNTKKIEPTAKNKELVLPKPKFLSAPKNPAISVILLTYNQWKYTELCLRSLAYAQKKNPQLKVEYIVVDNASQDETPQELKNISGIKFIANKKNYGFAAGNNIGIRAAKGKDIVLLNNDTIVSPDWLARLHHHAQKIDRLGVLGPSTNTESGQALFAPQYNSLQEFFAYNEKISQENANAWEIAKKISGLCMYLPRHTIEKVGLLDTDYGIGYFEDDDYCLRVQDAGLRIVWAKDIYVHHFGSVSFENSSKKKEVHLNHGMSQFIFKWGKRGLEHVAKAHKETLIRMRPTKSTKFIF